MKNEIIRILVFSAFIGAFFAWHVYYVASLKALGLPDDFYYESLGAALTLGFATFVTWWLSRGARTTRR